MAKVKAPLLSFEANGAFAKRLTFKSGKNGHVVTNFHKPTGTPSLSQITVRNNFTEAKNRWNLLSSNDKLSWNISANSYNITGYNLFIKEFKNYDDMILLGKDDTNYSTIVNVSAGGQDLSKVLGLDIQIGDEIEVSFVASNRAIVAGVSFGVGLKIGALEVVRITGTGSRYAMDAKRTALWKFRFINKIINGSYPIQAFSASSSQWTLYQPALSLSIQHPVSASVIESITVMGYNTNGSAIVDYSDLKIHKIN